MEKYVRIINNTEYVGVVVSDSFFGGWSTCNNISPFDFDFINYLIEEEKNNITFVSEYEWNVPLNVERIENYFEENKKKYCLDPYDMYIPSRLKIYWIKKGTKFLINKLDEKENLKLLNDFDFYMA